MNWTGIFARHGVGVKPSRARQQAVAGQTSGNRLLTRAARFDPALCLAKRQAGMSSGHGLAK